MSDCDFLVRQQAVRLVRQQAVRRVSEYLTAMLENPLAFRGQQVRGAGPVAEFEALLAERCGYPYCVATCNATTVLAVLALLLRVKRKIVLFPKEHWEGSVSAFRLFGAKIHRYHNLDIDCRKMSKPAPAAIVVGNCHRILSSSPEIMIIEDSCRLPGCSGPLENRSAADIQVLSFGPGKPLPLGEGGAVLFRCKSLYQDFVTFSQHPERVAAEFLEPALLPATALNGRIHPVAALLGCELLRGY